jgi:L-ascorbate metabolism protein UlaG (beta-lactamase superfamily)
MKIKTCFLVALFTVLNSITAQIPHDEKLHFWGDIDGFINQQDKVTLNLVHEALEKYRPSLQEPKERKMAMLMLDGVLHEEKAAYRPAVQQFLRERIDLALTELEQTTVDKGAMIWKLYNHGFIIRTATVTFAFDLVRAHSAKAEGFSITDDTMKKIIDQCDALFISHRHRDHGDEWVAQTFIDENKPVVAPPEVWQDKPIDNTITHLKRVSEVRQELSVKNGKEKLVVINFPGHQGSNIENNVPLVFTPEGMSFVQTGDQSGPDSDWNWIDEVGRNNRVDVLFPNCWTPDIHRMAKGFDPELVMTGHENEMGHTIDHRESNWLTYTRLKGMPYPYLLLTWGESYHYIPKTR